MYTYIYIYIPINAYTHLDKHLYEYNYTSYKSIFIISLMHRNKYELTCMSKVSYIHVAYKMLYKDTCKDTTTLTYLFLED